MEYPGSNFVTIGMDKVEFRRSVRQGTILIFLVEQTSRGKTSLQYSVHVYRGDTSEYDNLIFSTDVTFVRIDEEGKKIPLPPPANPAT
jgi:acyl-CoA hydrolase